MTGSGPDPRWDVPIVDLVEARVAATPDAVVVRDHDGPYVTAAELAARADELRAGLASLGVGRGSRVGWQLPTRHDALALAIALAGLGAVQVPVPHFYLEHELHHVVPSTGMELLVTAGRWRGRDLAATARSVLNTFPGVGHAVLEPAGLPEPTTTAPGDPASPPPVPDAVRWLFLTSGTSGGPKAALHTDRTVTVAGTVMTDRFALRPADRAAVAFPLAHIGGIAWLVAALQSGCTLLLADRFGDDVIDGFDAAGVTLAGVSTAFHLAYRDRARALRPGRLFEHVRAYPGGAAPKPPALHRELREEIGGVGIVAGYGLTECPMVTLAAVDDPDDKLSATEGRPTPGVLIEIRDPATGNVVRDGEGELWVRGPQQCIGYLDAEQTRDAIDAAGFLRTGDLGTVDDDGFVTITGRLKELVIRNGENISVRDVEDLLYAHPDLADVAVVGVPDPRTGERCCAVVVLRPDRPTPTVATLADYLRGRDVMRQKWPEQVVVVDRLPRNASGKVLKRVLRDELSDARPAPDQTPAGRL